MKEHGNISVVSDEEACKSLFEELENLTDEEWAMLDEMSNNLESN